MQCSKPNFDNRPEVLADTYDDIASCEVVEHFHQPGLELLKLRSLLKPKGKLFVMTVLTFIIGTTKRISLMCSSIKKPLFIGLKILLALNLMIFQTEWSS